MRSALTRMAAALNLAAGALAAWSATSPIYINNSPVLVPPAIAPQIDATAFVNRSLFSIDRNLVIISGSSGVVINSRPYETLHTMFFTNTGSGIMSGDPGFRFNFSTNDDRLMMDTWVNQGSIGADSTYYYTTSGGSANWLLVSASNIISSGPINVGSQGLLRLEGRKIDLKRNGLRAGAPLTNSGILFGTSVLASNYINDVGITDIYWGTGTNDVLGGTGQPMGFGGFGLNDLQHMLPYPQSPYHQVVEGFSGYYFTNTVTVPSFYGFSDLYGAAVYTNQLGPTNFSIQVVFYPTNTFDPTFSRQVRFYPEFDDGGATVVVAFDSVDFDIVGQVYFTNSIYLIDALAYETNVSLARNLNATPTTRRPRTYEVTRNQPFFFSSFGAINGNATYTDTLLYNPATYASNRVQVRYAGYQVEVSSLTSASSSGLGTLLYDPTNLPGRIEILGDEVNLDQTRIRADTTLILRAGALTSNRVAQVDAPYVVFDVGSIEPLLVISNIAPDSVRRLNGVISAWSGVWRNYEISGTTTNAIDFHVLIVEDGLAALQPVVLSEFRVRATNVNIADAITVGKIMQLNMTGLDLQGSLQLPPGSSWGNTNVLNLVNFTNSGSLSLQGSASFGADRPAAYSNFVNQGTVSAASIFVRTRNLENSGTLVSSGGLLSVDALQGRLLGAPTDVFTNVFTNIFFGFTNVFTNIVTNSIGARLAGNSDIQIYAEDLLASNSLVQAGLSSPGGLQMNVTNRLVDGGVAGLNYWDVTAGFSMLRKPAQSDLLGTQIRSTVAPFAEADHVWAADDLGAVPEGFQNNLAVGRLILDARSALSTFHFMGSGLGKALYVDFLQFDNYATNVLGALTVDPTLTIYFADSNLSAEKLDGSLGGRLRWVPYFVGPHSGTNLTYASGRTVTLNRALATSTDRDDDNDGIANSQDPEPVLLPEIRLVLTHAPSWAAVLSWDSVAAHTNRVEFATSLTQVAWQNLTNIVNGPANARLEVIDPLPEGTRQRYYQIRVDPPHLP